MIDGHISGVDEMVLPEVRLFEVLFVNFMSDFLTDTKSRF
jgi:hypothetical protein